MRQFPIVTAASAALLLAAGIVADYASAADVGPPPPGYWAPPVNAPPIDYAPRPRVYVPAYPVPYAVAPAPVPDDGPSYEYEPPPRAYGPPPYTAAPYAAAPVRPVCDRQWQCGPWGCGWRPVCYPEAYAGSYRRYGRLPAEPGYYGPY